MNPPPQRVPLANLPTPIHRLNRVSADLKIDLWIKRDDLTGFALGGNKARKLEYLSADILAARTTVVVGCGSTQSNFIRQLGAACVIHDIRCVAVVMDLPFPDNGVRPNKAHNAGGGNLVIDEILGVEIHRIPDAGWTVMEEHAALVANQLRASGETVYEIPIGGSTALGAYGFRQAGAEISEQTDAFDFIVTASSSGSTQTGLAHYYHGSETRVVGISCDPEPEIVDDLVSLAGDLDRLTGISCGLKKADFDFRLDFVGAGYGIASEDGDAAIRYLAQREGILLDPVYSGKAFAGLCSLARSGEIHGRVLFWHTGGMPALFTSPTVD